MRSSYLLPLESEEDLDEDDFDDEVFEDDPDDFEPDPEEELLLPETEDPRDDDEGLLCDIAALLPEEDELLDGALITLPELPEDEAEGLLTGPAGDDLLTAGLEGALLTEEFWVLPD